MWFVTCRSDGEDPVLDACLLHCINHCSKTAELIKKTNQQAKADPDFEAPRDQGFTRPKVQTSLTINLLQLPSASLPLLVWAARYTTWILIEVTPKGLVFSFLFCQWWSQLFSLFSKSYGFRTVELWCRQQAHGTCPALLWGLQTSCLRATCSNCALCKHHIDDESCWPLVPCVTMTCNIKNAVRNVSRFL